MIRVLLCAVLVCLFASARAFADIPNPVKTASGLIAGVEGSSSGMRVFKGVPFAAPPVGPLRWKPPQPPASWDGVRQASQFGPRCMQGNGTAKDVSEDCLYLNVWTAASSAAERRPVILWTYGGSLRSGSGSQPDYDGEALARKGVVFVTYNYRLGMFGFFSHPELTQESAQKASGNYGFMDLVAALQWIQANITNFGGDPARVTIMGESAGASLVSCLVASPAAKGLFHRAIAQSTGCTGTSRIGAPLTTLAQAEQEGQKTAASLGAKTLAELRALPATTVLKGQGMRVIVDGWTMTEDWFAALAGGRFQPVDLLLGSNKDEGTFGIFGVPEGNAQEFTTRSRQRFGSLADTYMKLYPAGSDAESDVSQLNAFRDLVFWNLRTWVRHQTANGRTKAYMYFFTREPPVGPGERSRGATHTAEIVYAFNNLNASRNRPWTDVDRRLAETMSSYWVNFAKTGDPNGDGLPAWPVYKAGTNNAVMVLGETAAAGQGPDPAGLTLYDQHYKVGDARAR